MTMPRDLCNILELLIFLSNTNGFGFGFLGSPLCGRGKHCKFLGSVPITYLKTRCYIQLRDFSPIARCELGGRKAKKLLFGVYKNKLFFMAFYLSIGRQIFVKQRGRDVPQITPVESRFRRGRKTAPMK